MGPEIQPTPDDANAFDPEALLKEAQEFHKCAAEREKENFDAAADDLRMLGKDQWDREARAEREGYGRPVVSLNRFPTYLAQVTGEVRRNKPSIHCSPADGAADKDTAELMEGVIRNVERLSDAPSVYAAVAKSVAACGIGHLRLRHRWADEESFDSELQIELLPDPFSVFWDECKRADKGDAKQCLVVTEMAKSAFNKAYPKHNSATWAQSRPYASEAKWRTDEKVTVAEYWVVKEEPVKLLRLVHNKTWFDPEPKYNEELGYWDLPGMRAPTGQETILADPDDAIIAEALESGFSVVQERTAYRKKVCMYLLGGNAVIEGPVEWPGQRIPIFTCVGEEIHTGGEVIRHGLIRWVKDAQKIFNLARATDLEVLSMAPKSPWVVDTRAIEGHEDIWDSAHRVPYPYLPRNGKVNGEDVPKPEKQDPISQNPGPQALAAVSNDDLQAGMGIFNASIGQRSNETSGKAIDARDAQSDTGTFVYIDNLNTTIAAMGQEAVNVIPATYSTRKLIAIVGPDDTPAIVDLEQAGVDFNRGKYQVICKPGPAYQTRRDKAADRLATMMQVAPPQFVPIIFEQLARLDEMPNNDEFIEKLQAIGQLTGVLPPPPGAGPQAMPMPPGMGPPMGGPPMEGDPLANVLPPSGPVPAPGPVVAAPMPMRPPGMMGVM